LLQSQLVAAAAGVAVLGVCQPKASSNHGLKASVVSVYCSKSSKGCGLSLGWALVRVMRSSKEDVAMQRAGVVVEGFCRSVLWEPDLWLETWRGLSRLLESSCSTTRTVGMRTLRLMLRYQPSNQQLPVGSSQRWEWEEQVKDEYYESLQVLVPQLVTAAAVAVGGADVAPPAAAGDGEAMLGVQLLSELLQQLKGRSELLGLKAGFRSLAPFLKGLKDSCMNLYEVQAAGEQVLRHLHEARIIVS